MAVIAPCRGFNYSIPVSGKKGEAFYKVEGLATGQKENPILITGVTSRDKDIVMPVTTLENTKVLYTFGADFGEVTVTGVILLGSANNKSDSLGKLVNFFQEKRVSKSSKSVKVTGPAGVSWAVFLTSLTIGDVDPTFNIQTFALTGSVAQPK